MSGEFRPPESLEEKLARLRATYDTLSARRLARHNPFYDAASDDDDDADFGFNEGNRAGADAPVWSHGDPWIGYFSPTPEQRREFSGRVNESVSALEKFFGTFFGTRREENTRVSRAPVGFYGQSGEQSSFRPASVRPAPFSIEIPRANWETAYPDTQNPWEAPGGVTTPTISRPYESRLRSPVSLFDSFPVVAGHIITPSIFVKQGGLARDDISYQEPQETLAFAFRRAFHGDSEANIPSIESRAAKLIREGYTFKQAGSIATRAAMNTFRSNIQSFPQDDYGREWSFSAGLKARTLNSVRIVQTGEYRASPHDLTRVLQEASSPGMTYVTRKPYGSVDPFNRQRGAHQAWAFEPVAMAVGYFPEENNTWVVGRGSPVKRVQANSQRILPMAPKGWTPSSMDVPWEPGVTTPYGRVTKERSVSIVPGLFLENYSGSEGTFYLDPGAVGPGLLDMRIKTIEKPFGAPNNWKVAFAETKRLTRAGGNLQIGQQLLPHMVEREGKLVEEPWQALGTIHNKPGTRMWLHGSREILDPSGDLAGYQVSIGSLKPMQSGLVKAFHEGVKALGVFRNLDPYRQARAVSGYGEGLKDVQAVLPMWKNEAMYARALYEHLPMETMQEIYGSDLDKLDLSAWSSMSKDTRSIAVNRMMGWLRNERAVEFIKQEELPASKFGVMRAAHKMALAEGRGPLITDVLGRRTDPLSGEDFISANVRYTGYVAPAILGFRPEDMGRKPKLSSEELSYLAQRNEPFAKVLMRSGSPAARLMAVSAGFDDRAVAQEDVPYMDVRSSLGVNAKDEDVLVHLAKVMRERGQVGPIQLRNQLLPNPNDILSNSVKTLALQEESALVSHYSRALLQALGGVPGSEKSLTRFQETFSDFAQSAGLRKQAMGVFMRRAVEGPYVGDPKIPAGWAVAGDAALRSLARISGKELPDFKRELAGGLEFYSQMIRRPVDDPRYQAFVNLRIASTEMAQKMWGLDLPNLDEAVALDPITAAAARGDTDADRAIIFATTKFRRMTEEVRGIKDEVTSPPPGIAEAFRRAYGSKAKFVSTYDTHEWLIGQNERFIGVTPRSVLDRARYETQASNILGRQLEALKLRSSAPAIQNAVIPESVEDRASLLASLSTEVPGKAGGPKMVHQWNELYKWAEELSDVAVDRTLIAQGKAAKYTPNYEQMRRMSIGDIANDYATTRMAKVLNSRAYDYFGRKAATLIRPEETTAWESLFARMYQPPLDVEEQPVSALQIYDLLETWSSKAGARRFEFSGQGQWYPENLKATPEHILASTVSLFMGSGERAEDFGLPQNIMAQLFSRDPKGQELLAQGKRAEFWRYVNKSGGAEAFLGDENRAGVIPQLMASAIYGRGTTRDVQFAEPWKRMYQQKGLQAERYRLAVGKRKMPAEELVKLLEQASGGQGFTAVKRMLANRMRLHGDRFFTDEELQRLSNVGIRSFSNKTLRDKDSIIAAISQSEAEFLDIMRRTPPEMRGFAKEQWNLKHMATTGSAGAESASAASIPVMITRDVRQQLYDLGYKRIDVDKMTPVEAHSILAAKPPSSSAFSSVPEDLQAASSAHAATLDKLVIPEDSVSSSSSVIGSRLPSGFKRNIFGVNYDPRWRKEAPDQWQTFVKATRAAYLEERGAAAEQAYREMAPQLRPTKNFDLRTVEGITAYSNKQFEAGDFAKVPEHVGSMPAFWEMIQNEVAAGHRITMGTTKKGWISYGRAGGPSDLSEIIANFGSLKEQLEFAVTRSGAFDENTVARMSNATLNVPMGKIADSLTPSQLRELPLEKQLSTARSQYNDLISMRQKLMPGAPIDPKTGEHIEILGPAAQSRMDELGGILREARVETTNSPASKLTDAMIKLRETITKSTEVQTKLTEVFKPGSGAFGLAKQTLHEAYQGARAGQPLTEEMQQRLAAARAVFAFSGRERPFRMADQALASQQAADIQEGLIGQMGGGQQDGGGIWNRIRTAWNAGGDQRRDEMGQMFYGGLGALGFGMFNMQRWWRYTGGALSDWEQRYASQQLSAQQGAFAAGAMPTSVTGSPQDIFSRQAAVANLNWRLGESASRTWGESYTNAARTITGLPDWAIDAGTKGIGIAGVLGLGQLGSFVIGRTLGLQGLERIGPLSLAKSAAGRVAGAFTGSGAEVFPGVTAGTTGGTGLLGGFGMAALTGATAFGVNTAQSDIETANMNPLMRGLAMSAASGNWATVPMYLGAKLGGNIVSAGAQFLNKQFGTNFQVPQTVQPIPASPEANQAADSFTAQARRIAERNQTLSVEELTVISKNVSVVLGKQATDKLVESTALRGRLFPGGVEEQMQYYYSMRSKMGLVPGSIGAEGVLQSFSQMSYPQLQAAEIATSMFGPTYVNRGYTVGAIQNAVAPYAANIAAGVPIGIEQGRWQLAEGESPITAAVGLPAGLQQAKNTGMDVAKYLPNRSEAYQRAFGGALQGDLFSNLSGGKLATILGQLGKAGGAFEQYAVTGSLSRRGWVMSQELATRSTPWGYSMGLAQDAGMSLQQLYAGQTAPGALQDIYGREAGYAGLFAAQQASGWANYRLSAASIPIQRAQWERQQATTRMEYGGGALQPLQNVMLALSRPRDEQGNLAPTINPTGLPGGEIGVSGEVGVGLNVGGSAIGLVQQEAGIRRQMWQENLNAQRTSIGFQQQQLQIAREQLQLSKQEYGVRREYQIAEREAGRSQSLLQRSWATEDYNIGQQRMGIQQQWAQEDIDRAIRYSSGRERQQLLRQRDRMNVTQGWERDDSQRNRRRQEELWRREDERYSNAVKYEEQLNAIQMQKFALQEKSLALQEAQLAAQAAHIENIAKLQTDLQKIEDDRFKNQYDNIQAQLKEEEILQPLREDAQRAELAYMALRLQHAQEMHDAEIAAWKAISGFIESLYNAQKNGGFGPPPTEPGGPTAGTWVLGANGWTWNAGNSGAERSPTRAPRSLEQPVINTSKGGQPVVVEIMMDTQKVGEILLTPERLRRGTKVLLEREKWR